MEMVGFLTSTKKQYVWFFLMNSTTEMLQASVKLIGYLYTQDFFKQKATE